MKFKVRKQRRLMSNSKDRSDCELHSYFKDNSNLANSVIRNFRIRSPRDNPEIYWTT